MSDQISLPVKVRAEEVARERSLGGAITLCAKVAGYELDKELQQTIGADKAQFSRWLSNQEGVTWPKLVRLMDACGNDTPVLWMLHQRNYDITSIRRRESEIERENRELREQNAALLKALRVAA